MLSPNIKKVLEGLRAGKENNIYEENKPPYISINKLTGKAGVFYEKVRYLVDYKDGHTIRRSAIERILKIKLLIKSNRKIGLSLLQELVSSGYLPNKMVPESSSAIIQTIIDKYLSLGDKAKLENRVVISLMASEIERLLYPQLLNDLVANSFYFTFSDKITCAEEISPEDLDIQIYIGCRRSLLDDDQETLLYHVLVKHLPELPGLTIQDEIDDIAPKFSQAISLALKEIEEPLGWKLFPNLGMQFINEFKGTENDEIDRNHGGQFIYIIPGFTAKPLDRLILNASMPIPVYQELNGTHQKQAFTLQFTVGVRF